VQLRPGTQLTTGSRYALILAKRPKRDETVNRCEPLLSFPTLLFRGVSNVSTRTVIQSAVWLSKTSWRLGARAAHCSPLRRILAPMQTHSGNLRQLSRYSFKCSRYCDGATGLGHARVPSHLHHKDGTRLSGVVRN